MTTYEGTADRIERAAFQALLRVPEAIRRRIDLRPRVIEGHRLDPDTNVGLQILTRLPNKGVRRASRARGPPGDGPAVGMFAGDPTPVGATRPDDDPRPGGGIPAQLYRPLGVERERPLPLLVYFHGGGWVLGDIDTHDLSRRFPCAEAGIGSSMSDYRWRRSTAFRRRSTTLSWPLPGACTRRRPCRRRPIAVGATAE